MTPHHKRSLWLKSLFRVDHFLNRLYSPEYNPIYQSGTLALLFLLIASVSGFYLLFFYKVSAPYESVSRIQEHIFLGAWVRSVHRLASDLAVLSILFHVIRVGIQKRFDGPRLFVWITGIFFTAFVFLCGWTGLAMIWDAPGYALVTSLARIFDLFPIFIEPIELSLIAQITQPRSFFFMLLFFHVSLPLGLIFAYWLHTTRLARAAVWPHKKLSLSCLGIVLFGAALWQYPMEPVASIYKQIVPLKFNLFYEFWLPVAIRYSPFIGLVSLLLIPLSLLAVPFLVPTEKKQPSSVNEKSCTGCTSCYIDCPFEAINMVPRTSGQGSEFVARVNPNLCVSCGICAGACDPMGVGPYGKTGRDQLKIAEQFLSQNFVEPGKPVIMACAQTWNNDWDTLLPKAIHLVPCTGNVHTSVIEYLIRKGSSGILIYTCPPRNCFNREGPKMLHARLFEGHDSALKDQVDKRRIRVVPIDLYDTEKVRDSYHLFCKDLADFGLNQGESHVHLEIHCPTESQT